jgi:hypothetical protein
MCVFYQKHQYDCRNGGFRHAVHISEIGHMNATLIFHTISFFFSIAIALFTFSSFLSLFSRFLGVILIAISEANYIKHCTDRNYVHKHAFFGRNPSCSYVKPVVTRGSTAHTGNGVSCAL